MSDLPLLSRAHMQRLEPQFPRSRGLKRVDDRRVLSGINYVIRNGLMWKDASRGYGPHKTLWSRVGVFTCILAELVAEAGVPERLMIDATQLQAHRTVASLLQKGALMHRMHQGRAELQAARRVRPAGRAAAHRRTDEQP